MACYVWLAALEFHIGGDRGLQTAWQTSWRSHSGLMDQFKAAVNDNGSETTFTGLKHVYFLSRSNTNVQSLKGFIPLFSITFTAKNPLMHYW